MYQQGAGDFKYYVGIRSLAQIATRDDRVCVLNILGGMDVTTLQIPACWRRKQRICL